MHEVRWNPLCSRFVAFAPERAGRPHVAARDVEGGVEGGDGRCALCEGNESLTPPEVFSVRKKGGPDEPGWTSRVVPNLYPAVEGPGRYHEVVVHSPTHKSRLAYLDPLEIEAVGEAWIARLAAVSGDARTVYFQAGVNQGRDGGASLTHSHSQLLALDLEPPVWRSELESLSDPAACPLCEPGGRGGVEEAAVADSTETALAICPSWSEFPYEVLAFPRDHVASFSDSPDVLFWVLSLASRLDSALEQAAGVRAFNVVFHTGLPGSTGPRFHWHAHIYPRIAALASIELGTGIYISTVDHESAAAEIRQALKPGTGGL